MSKLHLSMSGGRFLQQPSVPPPARFSVKAYLVRKRDKKEVMISDAQMRDLVLSKDETLPKSDGTIESV